MSGEVQADDSAGYAAIRKHWAYRVLALIIPLIVSSIFTYTTATGISRGETAVVKDKAEAGYQATEKNVEFFRGETVRLEARLARLDAEVLAIRKAIKKNAPKIRVAPPLAPVPPAARLPAPLPPNLDKALEQVQAGAPVPPAPATEPPR